VLVTQRCLNHEPLRIEVRERLFQLLQLRRRAVHFYPGEIGHGQHFREQRADVLNMREQTLGVLVCFPAKHFLAVGSEPVEKILFFSRSFVDEPRESGFDRFQFSGGAL